MEVELASAIEPLRRTPDVARALFDGLSGEWLEADEGPGTWTAFGTLAHIVHVEPNWMARLSHIAKHGESSPIPLVDRTDHMSVFGGVELPALLDEFDSRRTASLAALGKMKFDPHRPGLHQELGPVQMGNLLAAWVTHDHNHVGQIIKAMAKQYREAIGPWREFLPIVDAL